MSTERLATTSQQAPVASGWRLPFGLISMMAVSLVFCYGQVLISLLVPTFGLAPLHLNIHVQAVFMWLFGLVTVYGLVRDRRAHGSMVPLATGICAVLIIAGTLYTFYDIRVLIIGYVLLVIAALLDLTGKDAREHADTTAMGGFAYADFVKLDIPPACGNLLAWRERVAARPSAAAAA